MAESPLSARPISTSEHMGEVPVHVDKPESEEEVGIRDELLLSEQESDAEEFLQVDTRGKTMTLLDSKGRPANGVDRDISNRNSANNALGVTVMDLPLSIFLSTMVAISFKVHYEFSNALFFMVKISS